MFALTISPIEYLFSYHFKLDSVNEMLESWSVTKIGWEGDGKPIHLRLHCAGDKSGQNSVEMMFRAELSETEGLPHRLQLYLYRPISLFLPRSSKFECRQPYFNLESRNLGSPPYTSCSNASRKPLRALKQIFSS